MAMEMLDMNPGAVAQPGTWKKVPKAQAPAPAPAQPKFTAPPKAPAVGPNRAAVQRVAMPVGEPTGPSILDEMAAEFRGTEEATAIPAPSERAVPGASEEDPEIQNYIQRFKGDPQEMMRQLAKAGVHAEKRMRQLEQERSLFSHQPTQTVTTGNGLAVPPAQQQVSVTPQFKYARFEEEILDKGKGAKVAEDFEQHIVNKIMAQISEPLHAYGKELLSHRMFRAHPDVINETNVDIVHAMAQSEPGQNFVEKAMNAAKRYADTMKPATPSQFANADVQSMQDAAFTPPPQARTSGGKKMWRESDLREAMQQKMRKGGAEYAKWRPIFDQAYRDGRVLKGQ